VLRDSQDHVPRSDGEGGDDTAQSI
jgi:hypothetical protein